MWSPYFDTECSGHHWFEHNLTLWKWETTRRAFSVFHIASWIIWEWPIIFPVIRMLRILFTTVINLSCSGRTGTTAKLVPRIHERKGLVYSHDRFVISTPVPSCCSPGTADRWFFDKSVRCAEMTFQMVLLLLFTFTFTIRI